MDIYRRCDTSPNSKPSFKYDRLLRVRGRTGRSTLPCDSKYPIAVDPNQPLTQLILENYDRNWHHSGKSHVLPLTKQFRAIKRQVDKKVHLSRPDCIQETIKILTQFMDGSLLEWLLQTLDFSTICWLFRLAYSNAAELYLHVRLPVTHIMEMLIFQKGFECENKSVSVTDEENWHLKRFQLRDGSIEFISKMKMAVWHSVEIFHLIQINVYLINSRWLKRWRYLEQEKTAIKTTQLNRRLEP